MRKIFLPMVIVLVLMASLSMKSLAQRGDVNEDGMVNITDVTTLIDYLLSRTWTGICKTVTVGDVSFKMIYVDGGTFMMGSEDTTLTNFHYPPHEVTLSGFYMGQTEVTQALWYAVMGSNPSYHKGADFPVEYITWEEQLQFVDRLNAMTGMSFRIPTEAEWEFAARGGKLSHGYDYAGGNDLDEVAWHRLNSGGTTHAVATKRANELGLYDMTGNVYERVSDFYAPYTSKPQINPTGPEEEPDPALGSTRMNRGGGAAGGNWGNYYLWLRCRQRSDYKGYYDGLRLAM